MGNVLTKWLHTDSQAFNFICDITVIYIQSYPSIILIEHKILLLLKKKSTDIFTIATWQDIQISTSKDIHHQWNRF